MLRELNCAVENECAVDEKSSMMDILIFIIVESNTFTS